MKTKLTALAAAACAFTLVLAGLDAAGQETKKASAAHLWDGSLTTPVHLLQLRDENDAPIIPTETSPLPFSARFTCGPCHDYDTVRKGLHFDTAGEGWSGRPGEPWFRVDERTGTVLPISYRGWPGSYKPAELGLTAWDMALLFGRHMPGGGPAEPAPEEQYPDPHARWNVSGKAEVNCLACHNRSPRQDHSEWAKQVARENLRWAATAAAGIGEVGGMASRLPNTWDVYDGPNPDDKEWAVAPFVRYEPTQFDSKHRFLFDLDHQPADSRCLACHSATPAGATRAGLEPDVHRSAGIKCADCHRNGLSHDMVRGYPGEGKKRDGLDPESFTCRGCHLGESADGERKVLPGRAGAPYPRHPGIPLVHFKRLNCTVCHSGPALKDGFTRLRTSRANRLGIYGVARWATDYPAVFAPVYAEDGAGKIAPNRLVWPSFWARLSNEKVVPVRPEEVEAAAGDILNSEARVAAVLQALSNAAAEGETPVLAAGGFLFQVNVDGGLDAVRQAEAGRVQAPLWAFRKDGSLEPLVKDFDPDSPDKDPDVETRIQALLEALGTINPATGAPVFIIKDKLYRLTEGYLDMTDAPKELGPASGFGRLREGLFVPLASEFDVRTLTARAGREETLTEEQVALVLEALKKQNSGDAGVEFAYISSGRMFRLTNKGKLAAADHPAAGPVLWPLAHDVRPAQQSLGWNGCSDCHSAGSTFFFSKLEGRGPLLTKKGAVRASAAFMGRSGLFQRFFGLTFLVRPLLKVVLAVCIIILASLFLFVAFSALGRISDLADRR
jgi:hypothetical protein